MIADADLAARITETAALIERELGEDERIALATIDINDQVRMRRGEPAPRWVAGDGSDIRSDDRYGILRVKHTWARERDHIIRHDPARALRHVSATRELVAEILAEEHEYEPGGYGCSRAPRHERAGESCDCGRDKRVARRLDIIAGEWREGA